jgi:pyruvate dehydrogenase E2 component (dihydrolipoamide acetyltransferase)
MTDPKTFHLPDLGEGLPDATIVEWFVKQGDTIRLDEPLVSMETAKAVVEVPSPISGKVLKLAGNAGDIVVTGAMLAEFEPDPSLPQRADSQDTGHAHGPAKPHAAAVVGGASAPTGAEAVGAEAPSTTHTERDDAGTVVGAMQSSNAVHEEQAFAVGGIKAMPAVRATAKKLGVDLARVIATGADGAVTMADVKQAAAEGSAKLGTPLPLAGKVGARSAPGEGSPPSALRAPSPASGRRVGVYALRASITRPTPKPAATGAVQYL